MHFTTSDHQQVAGLQIHAADIEIKRQAKILAKNISRITERNPEIYLRHNLCEKYVHRKNISPPEIAENLTIEGAINRMLDHQWWVRQIRTKLNRLAERREIHIGSVHRFASTYVSNRTLNKRKAEKYRNRRTLESLFLVNEEGVELNMLEVAEHSIANPANKRAELMCRIAGFEEYAKSTGDAGVFLTFTCPSRMHARLARSGKQNPKYDGSTPKESNQYLNKLWQRIRAKLARDNIHPYGFRVAEPQHDGTPHWHLLLFAEKHNIPALVDICKTYNLQDTPEEPGAKEHRFRCVKIDWNKGSAAGYIAKYIAKNIDGAHIEKDTLGNDAKEAAEKVEAWASTWGIRQFQQIGGSPVTIWRELRKAHGSTKIAELRPAVQAADNSNWFEFQKFANGIKVPRLKQELHLEKLWNDSPGKYGDPRGYVIFGVNGKGAILTTRLHNWTVIQGVPNEMLEGSATAHLERLLAPWSSDNNCTHKGNLIGYI